MPISTPVLGKVSYEPIVPWRAGAGGASFAQYKRLPEGATQTFKKGVPLMFSSGYLVEWDGGAGHIVGFSAEPGHNLAVAGTAEAGVSEGTAPNQASSKIIPVGAHFRDGNVGVYIADGVTTFSIAVQNDDVFAQALVVPATYYGLTKDATSGFWYIDFDDTSGNNAVAILLGNDPSAPNTTTDGARVYFQVASARRALLV